MHRIAFESTAPQGAAIASSTDAPAWMNYGSYVDIVGFDVSAPNSREGIESDASYVRVIGDRVHDVARTIACTNSGGAAINHASYTSTGNEATGNWVYNVGSPGCNFFQGIYVSQSAGTVQNNIVYRVAAWGIHTWHAATGITIANNLVFAAGTPDGNVGGGILVGAGDNPPGAYANDFIVSNNIVLDSVQGIAEFGRIGTGNRYINNLLYGNVSGIDLTYGEELGTLQLDPGLVDYRADGSGDYHLGPDSVAIDAGTTIGAPAYDIEGRPRPHGSAPDIGPYER